MKSSVTDYRKAWLDAEQRIRELEDALRFYANEDDYLWYGDRRGTIQKNDRGAVARTALKGTT